MHLYVSGICSKALSSLDRISGCPIEDGSTVIVVGCLIMEYIAQGHYNIQLTKPWGVITVMESRTSLYRISGYPLYKGVPL